VVRESVETQKGIERRVSGAAGDGGQIGKDGGERERG